MDLKDPATCLLIWQRELNLPVNAACINIIDEVQEAVDYSSNMVLYIYSHTAYEANQKLYGRPIRHKLIVTLPLEYFMDSF